MGHCKLQAASYYLNPMLPYDAKFKVDYEVKREMYDCLDRLVGDTNDITKIDELRVSRPSLDFFGSMICALNQNFITMVGIIW